MQKTVSLYPAVGVPGQEVNVHTAVYTPFNYLSDGTAVAGSFVFPKANEDDGGGAVYSLASATGSGTVLGFVENTFTGVLDYNEEGTLVYPKGANLTIAIRGQFYAEATGSATEGQAVLCDPATGAVTYGSSGDTNDTGWVVRLPQGVSSVEEGDLVIYENYGANP